MFVAFYSYPHIWSNFNVPTTIARNERLAFEWNFSLALLVARVRSLKSRQDVLNVWNFDKETMKFIATTR